jgi:hypothetical protein
MDAFTASSRANQLGPLDAARAELERPIALVIDLPELPPDEMAEPAFEM